MDVYLYYIGPFVLVMVMQGYFSRKFKGRILARNFLLLVPVIFFAVGYVRYSQLAGSADAAKSISVLYCFATAICSLAGYLMGWFIYLMMNRKVNMKKVYKRKEIK